MQSKVLSLCGNSNSNGRASKRWREIKFGVSLVNRTAAAPRLGWNPPLPLTHHSATVLAAVSQQLYSVKSVFRCWTSLSALFSSIVLALLSWLRSSASENVEGKNTSLHLDKNPKSVLICLFFLGGMHTMFSSAVFQTWFCFFSSILSLVWLTLNHAYRCGFYLALFLLVQIDYPRVCSRWNGTTMTGGISIDYFMRAE